MNIQVTRIDEAEVRLEAKRVLEKIYARLGDYRRWTSQAFARDQYGHPVAPMDTAASRWDLVGALHRETTHLDSAMGVSVRALIRRTLMGDRNIVGMVPARLLDRPGSDNLSTVNDKLSHPELMDWLFGAINQL